MAGRHGKAVYDVSTSIENFTIDFHEMLASKTEGNFVLSALSAHAALAMTAYGARGSTAQVMRTALHLPEDDFLAHQEFQNLIGSFENVLRVTLKLANKIYISTNIPIKDEFKKITGTYFQAESENVDFGNNVAAAKLISDWCIEKTDGKVQEILEPKDLHDRVVMVLLNAVYFKGNWKIQFDEELTRPKPFHIDERTTVEVPTMILKGEEFFFAELEEVDAEVVALPYMNRNMYMVIIIPNEINGLAMIEKNLGKIELDSEDFKYLKREMLLALPKFRIESSHNLEQHLKDLGMDEIFDEDEANFKGICEVDIFVSKVIQKAFIEVNEKGSEAAAVTAVREVSRSPGRSPTSAIAVRVDRPFFFKIMFKDCTLFSGRVSDPRK